MFKRGAEKLALFRVDLRYVCVKIITRSGRFNVAFADGEIAKALALLALFGVANENRLKLIHNLLVGNGGTVELVQTLAVETGT